jgi:uncharacterized protein YndB with AHSA1/START domain
MDFDPGPLADVAGRPADDGGYTLIFVRDLRHPPAKVWTALTEPDQLAAWSPFTTDRDLGRPGDATLTMEDGTERVDLAATVHRAEPPTLLEYTWGTDRLRWELAPAGAGTRLTLSHTVQDPDWAPKVAAGWHLCLVVAERLLDGDPITPIRGQDAMNYGWQELADAYETELMLAPAEDGRVALRFERRFAHPRPKVWRAITETEQLRAWFVDILDYDESRLRFVEGADLDFAPRTGSGAPTGHGKVTRIDPPRLLEFTWDGETLRWELEPDGDDACRLVFTNIVGDRETGTAVAPGWREGLDRLSELLEKAQ